MILQPMSISIKIAIVSTVFVLIIGVILARVFTKHNFRGKDILEILIILPMVLPPSVTGYGLLVLIGRNGLIGKVLYNFFNVSLVFTWVAACIAAAIVSLPLMYQSCKAAFLKVNPIYEDVARTFGASEITLFWKVTIPLAWPGIVSGIVLSFARALGEFGATLMVAGNIPGKTQTIPIAIYFAVESGNTRTVNILIAIVVAFSFITVFSLNKWIKGRAYIE